MTRITLVALLAFVLVGCDRIVEKVVCPIQAGWACATALGDEPQCYARAAALYYICTRSFRRAREEEE